MPSPSLFSMMLEGLNSLPGKHKLSPGRVRVLRGAIRERHITVLVPCGRPRSALTAPGNCKIAPGNNHVPIANDRVIGGRACAVRPEISSLHDHVATSPTAQP